MNDSTIVALFLVCCIPALFVGAVFLFTIYLGYADKKDEERARLYRSEHR